MAKGLGFRGLGFRGLGATRIWLLSPQRMYSAGGTQEVGHQNRSGGLASRLMTGIAESITWLKGAINLLNYKVLLTLNPKPCKQTEDPGARRGDGKL